MKKNTQFIFGLFILPLLVFWSSSAFCSMMDKEEMRVALTGVTECTVTVEVSDKIKSVQFVDQIRTDLELKLRLVGLTVISAKTSENKGGNSQWESQGRPTIAVEVVAPTYSETAPFIFCVTVSLIQQACLSRDSNVRMGATTWSKVGVGLGDFELIRKHIKNDLLDVFLNDYLSVNPR